MEEKLPMVDLKCILLKQLPSHLLVQYILSLMLPTLVMILSTYTHHAYTPTYRWSCNTQAVSGFAKDWIEPIVDKFKLPVGIGELIGSCSTSRHCLQTFLPYSFDSLIKNKNRMMETQLCLAAVVEALFVSLAGWQLLISE